MDRLIYATIAVLLGLTLFFSYKVRDYRFVLLPEPVAEKVELPSIQVVSRPIVFDAQRKFLTALYREKHTGDCDHEKKGMDDCLLISPKIIVLHMTDLDSLEQSFEYMKEPVLREERDKLISRSYDRLNVSAHYLVDRDGTIYSLMPDNYMGRHAMGVNHLAIGIENVGMNGSGPTREQVDANVKLVQYLMKKYDISPDRVYSHADVGTLREKNSPYFVEKDANYFMQKNCGEKIIKEVINRIKS